VQFKDVQFAGLTTFDSHDAFIAVSHTITAADIRNIVRAVGFTPVIVLSLYDESKNYIYYL